MVAVAVEVTPSATPTVMGLPRKGKPCASATRHLSPHARGASASSSSLLLPFPHRRHGMHYDRVLGQCANTKV